MKVLQINALYGFGSTGRTTKELDCELQKNGIESIVAVTKTEELRDNIYVIGNKLDWKLHAFMSRLTGKQAYFSKKELKFLKKLPLNKIETENSYKTKFIFKSNHKIGVDYK